MAEPPQKPEPQAERRETRRVTRFGGERPDKVKQEALEREQAENMAREKAARAKARALSGKRKLAGGKDGDTPNKRALGEKDVNVLPTRIVDGMALPTTDAPQSLDLPEKDYQSVRDRY